MVRKKEQGFELPAMLGGFKDSLIRNIQRDLKDAFYKLENQIFQTMLSLAVLVLALVFLLISLVFFMHYTLKLDLAAVFFIVGALLVIASIALSNSAKKTLER